MPRLSLISGGAILNFDGLGGDDRGVQLIALGKPRDHRPGDPPGTHGEPLGPETFHTLGIWRAEELLRGGFVVMRVGFVPQRIALIEEAPCKIPGYKIPATQSWRLGANKAEAADVFRIDRGHAGALCLQGVGFLAADSGFCQIALFSNGIWLTSYFVHVGFYNLAPKLDPRGISLIDAVVADLAQYISVGHRNDYLKIRAYYGMGICPEWYGVGDDYVRHVIERYGDDEASAMLRTPSAGPRKGNTQSISLQAMLDAEFNRSGIKKLCGSFEPFFVEGREYCPAALCDASGKPVLWSAVREADKTLNPLGKPTARNLIISTLPR